MKIAMIGSGGWGTAMVTSLAARHDDLELYCRREEAARELKETRENKEYLPGVRIPVHVKITSELEKAVSGADCVVLSTPSKAVEITAEAMAPFMKKNAVAVCASKGLADEAGHRLSEIISEKFYPDRIMRKKWVSVFRRRPWRHRKCRKLYRSCRMFSCGPCSVYTAVMIFAA